MHGGVRIKATFGSQRALPGIRQKYRSAPGGGKEQISETCKRIPFRDAAASDPITVWEGFCDGNLNCARNVAGYATFCRER